MDISFDTLKAVASLWGFSFGKPRENLLISGSPERTDHRLVVEDERGRLLILEKIRARLLPHKDKIAQTLAVLQEEGLPVAAYLLSYNGRYIEEIAGECWQVVPYVPGVSLDRPGYVFEAWRAGCVRDLIVGLRKAGDKRHLLSSEPVFDLPAYVRGLIFSIRKNRPDAMERLAPLISFVEKGLFLEYGSLPTSFCHGDLHAVNIIWGPKDIRALIDWEFLGVKPELYDLANFLGCLGIEDPESLAGPLAVSLVKDIMASGLFSPESFRLLPDLVIALRFAWLSEWLRKKDDEMLGLECDYFELLIENRDALASLWKA